MLGQQVRARLERTTMMKLRPHLLLIKPRPPRNESDCELEALRFLRSWKRAAERQALQARVNDAKTIKIAPTESEGSTDAAVA